MSAIMNLAVLAFYSGEKGGLLDVNPGLIFWTVITFVLLLIILRRVAWKPILNSLDEREKFIKESLEKADVAQKEAEKLVAENQTSMAKAEEEAQSIIAQGKEYAEKIKTQLLEENEARIQKKLADAEAEIERKQQEAFNSLKEQIVEIAVGAAEKIIRDNLDKEKQSALVNKYIDDLQKN